jgi:acetoin utilization deacetylase AcuC-like enzyme
MSYISRFTDSGSIQKIKQLKVDITAVKARDSESTCSMGVSSHIRNVNIPWAVDGVGDADYIYAFQKVVMPIAYEFNPQLVIVSAGFDAAAGDPLGGCEVSPAGYAHMTHMLMPLAEGKLVLVLEVFQLVMRLSVGWLQLGIDFQVGLGLCESIDGRDAWSTGPLEIICY